MKKVLLSLAAVVLFASPATFAADPDTKTKAVDTKPSVTYGRVKEMTAGQKVVIDVDNAVDKTFDLTDKDVRVKVGSGLKVGDPVKVTEHSKMGKTYMAEITKHSGGNVSHGDKKSAAAEKAAAK